MDRSTYRFGEFTLDPQARELRRADTLLKVSPKVFDCIVYLIERHERAVGRDELIAAVWGKVDVAYSLLGQLIAKARQVLGGTGNDQGAISTIPRFGYRWVAEFENAATQTASQPPDGGSGRRISERRLSANRRVSSVVRWSALILLPVIAIAVYSAWQLRSTSEKAAGSTAAVTTASIETSGAAAVLPVEGPAATGEWAWVRLGVMDLIADRLRSSGQTIVPSETVVALIRNGRGDQSGKIIQEMTGARYVVTPKATRANETWLVQLRLESANGEARVASARDIDVTTAGREAADQLLSALGHPVLANGDASSASLDEVLARAKAAMYSDDPDAARHILESAPTGLRSLPQFQQRMAQVDYRSGRPKAAADRLESLLGELGTESSPRLRASALNDLGAVAIDLEQASEAERRFKEALLVLADLEDPTEIGRAHNGNGIARAMRGDYNGAGVEFALSRVAYGVTGDVIAIAHVELNEVQLKILRGQFGAAEADVDRSERSFEHLGMRGELAAARGLHIEIALANLEIPKALAIGRRSEALLDSMQNPYVRQHFQLSWGHALTAAGRLTEAHEVFDGLQRTVDPATSGAPFVATVSVYRAILASANDNPEAVLKLAMPAIEDLTLPQYARERARAWLMATRALRALRRYDEAADEVQRLLRWAADGSKVPDVELTARLAHAEQTWSDGRYDLAGSLYDEVLLEAINIGIPADLAQVARSYGGILLAQNSLARASAVIGQVAGFADQDFGCALLQVRLYHALRRPDAWRVAFDNAHRLAGERLIPDSIVVPPAVPAAAE
jgi:DNA-binding winged helix-turn-helix (wHTH) protein/tetratricopeptide (TPR) repeat protein